MAKEYQLPLVSVTATELTGGNPEANVQDLFHKATKLAPCILLIENIESAKRNITTLVMENTIFIQLAESISDLRWRGSPVLVMCTTNKPDLLDETFRTRCFNIEHAVRIPNKRARESILQILCKKSHLADDVSLSNIAGLTRGYVGSDLKSLISLAITHAVHRVISEHELQRESLRMDSDSTVEGNSRRKDTLCEEMNRLTLTNVDIQKALAEVKPSLCREGWFVFSNTTWDDLGGMDSIRRELKLYLMERTRRPELYQAVGVKTAVGVLLVGPPGCGKTSVARAVANEAGIDFLYIKGAERNVRDLFKKAGDLAPCIIFFDEIDSYCPKRSSGSEERSAGSVTDMLLLEMDLLELRNKVYIIAATNKLDCLNPALLRSDRMDKIIYVGLPSPEGRVEILKALTKDRTRLKLADDVDLDSIGRDRRCDGFSGADLGNLVQVAKDISLEHIIESTEISQPFEVPVLNATHFETAFESVSASVNA